MKTIQRTKGEGEQNGFARKPNVIVIENLNFIMELFSVVPFLSFWVCPSFSNS